MVVEFKDHLSTFLSPSKAQCCVWMGCLCRVSEGAMEILASIRIFRSLVPEVQEGRCARVPRVLSLPDVILSQSLKFAARILKRLYSPLRFDS